MKHQDEKKHWIRTIKYQILRSIRFVSIDMWRVSPSELKQPFRSISSTLQVVYITVRSFIMDDLTSKASSLTYNTVLSIVPMLAVIVGIAKGFGLQTIVHDALLDALPSHGKEINQAFIYVENYLGQVQGELFVGLGLIILLYTVLMLIASIEDTFNLIWQAPHPRPWGRRILDYLGLFILLPILMTASSLLTLVRSSIEGLINLDSGGIIIAPIVEGAMHLIPFIISISLFTGLYMFLPNVKVRFVPALIAGSIAGLAFQIFQALYISGMLWISRYNAIYGSFAVFPLLLLWMQLSWTIVLIGAQLSYAIQNIKSFAFGDASKRISRRYKDFVSIIIMSRITQRFTEQSATPYQAETLSQECQIPLRLTTNTLARLEEIGLITEINHGRSTESGYYQPAIDTELLTVDYLLDRLDRFGVEDFRIDREQRFLPQWQATLSSRREGTAVTGATLLKDL